MYIIYLILFVTSFQFGRILLYSMSFYKPNTLCEITLLEYPSYFLLFKYYYTLMDFIFYVQNYFTI